VSGELRRRVIFSLIGAPVGVASVYYGDWVLATMLAILSALAAWELFRFARETGVEPLAPAGIVLAALVPIAAHASRLGIYSFPLTGFVALALLLFASSIWLRGPSGRPLAAVSVTVFGVIYAGMFAYLYALRYHPYTVDAAGGTALAALPVFLTWSTDIGAFVIGKNFGTKKLLPSVSPGKTVEGSAGGLIVTVIVSLLYVRFILMPIAHLGMTIQGAIIFGILISAAVQTGDLAESLLKREAGVKQSSSLFPGHGGVLDRFDGMLFALPLAFLLLGRLLLPIPI
jgi:phosphatidate cytidylyltransferase